MFKNQSIETSELPQVESLHFNSLERAYLKVDYIATGLFFLFLIAVFVVLYFTKVIKWEAVINYAILSAWAILFLFSMWHTWRNFRIKGYALRDHDVSYKSGVFFFSVTTIPFNRVQHVEIKEGPIERWFGLNTLQIFTAGGQSSDLVINGLSPLSAKQLKTLIINKTALTISDEEE